MFFRDKDKPMFSKVLVFLSVLATVFAAISALGSDLLLASTQWLLIAVLLSTWGVYWLLEAQFRS